MGGHDLLNLVSVPAAVAFRHSQGSTIFIELALSRLYVELLATGSVFLYKRSFCFRSVYSCFEATAACASSHSELLWQASLADAAVLIMQAASYVGHWSRSA
jgi:hypothetical protein